jgi:hypothetical protein
MSESENINKESEANSSVLIQWQAPEFNYSPKSGFWYFWLFFATALLLGFAFYAKNYSFGLIILLSFILIFVWSRKTPRIVDFAVTKQGIMISGKLHHFGELESFWIFYEPPEIKEVSVKSKKKILHYLKMPLEGENPARIRKTLIEYLPEVEQEESIFDSLARMAKF